MSLAWVGRPSFWYDEAATVAAADRPLADLWGLLEHRDLVHGLYYTAMHGWVRLFGTAEVVVRLPSVFATGVTCFLVYRLGDRLAGRPTAVAAGVVAAILPGLSWAGTEARSYALATALSTLASLGLLVALESGRTRDWVLYAMALAASAYVFLFAGLLLGCHLLTVTTVKMRRAPWALAAAAVTAATAPLVIAGAAQVGQISWISMKPGEMTRRALVDQYFVGPRLGDQHPLVLWCGVLLAFATVLATVLVAWLPAVRKAPAVGDSRLLIAVAVPWAVLPAALLITASALAQPVYVQRYAIFGAPAVALLLGYGVALLWEEWGTRAAAAAAAVLALLAGPALLLQKAPTAKGEYRSAAAFAEQATRGLETEVVLYANADALGVPRSYPQYFRDVAEPNRLTDGASVGLFGAVSGPDDLDRAVVQGRVVAVYRVKRQPDLGFSAWLVEQGCRALPEHYEDGRVHVTRYGC